jgi:hypothetical protein
MQISPVGPLSSASNITTRPSLRRLVRPVCHRPSDPLTALGTTKRPGSFPLPRLHSSRPQPLIRTVEKNVRTRHPDRVTTEPALVISPLPNPLQIGRRPPVSALRCARSRFWLYPGRTFGGGGGISSVPRWAGLSCQASLAFLKRSEILSFRWAMDMMVACPTFSAATRASTSARSFPGTPECPLTHAIATVRPSGRRPACES